MEDLVRVARKRLAQKKFPEEAIDRVLTPERVERLQGADTALDGIPAVEVLFAVLDEIMDEYTKEEQRTNFEQVLSAASSMGLNVDSMREAGERIFAWQQTHKDVPVSELLQNIMNFASTGKDNLGLGIADVLKGLPIFGCGCDDDEPVLPPEAERITIEVAIPDATSLGVLADERISRLFYFGEDNPPRSGCHWRGSRLELLGPRGLTAELRPTSPAFRTSEIPTAVLDTVLELLKHVTCDLATEVQSRQTGHVSTPPTTDSPI